MRHDPRPEIGYHAGAGVFRTLGAGSRRQQELALDDIAAWQALDEDQLAALEEAGGR